MVSEREIRAYQLKTKELLCPVCASDEEKAADDTGKITAEDVIHDSTSPLECVRCKKKIN
jgi:hypothetical protein